MFWGHFRGQRECLVGSTKRDMDGWKEKVRVLPPNAHSNDHNGHSDHVALSAFLTTFDLEFEEKNTSQGYRIEKLWRASINREEPKYWWKKSCHQLMVHTESCFRRNHASPHSCYEHEVVKRPAMGLTGLLQAWDVTWESLYKYRSPNNGLLVR